MMMLYVYTFFIYLLVAVINSRAVLYMNVSMEGLFTLLMSEKTITIMCSCTTVPRFLFFTINTPLPVLSSLSERDPQSLVQAHLLIKRQGHYNTTIELADIISLFQFTFQQMEKFDKIMNHLQSKFYETLQIF
jgi:hypothetical protein